MADPVRTWCFKGKLSMGAPITLSLVTWLGFSIHFKKSKPCNLAVTKGPRQVTHSYHMTSPQPQPHKGITHMWPLQCGLTEGRQLHWGQKWPPPLQRPRKPKRETARGLPLRTTYSHIARGTQSQRKPKMFLLPSTPATLPATLPAHLVTKIFPTAGQQRSTRSRVVFWWTADWEQDGSITALQYLTKPEASRNRNRSLFLFFVFKKQIES